MYHLSSDPSIPQGYCIIINNNTLYFEEDKIKEIKEMFEGHLGFHVQVYSDCTRKGILHLLKIVASTDHTDLYCLIVVILSKKGKKRVVYGSDGKKLPLNDILMLFAHNSPNVSPSLASRPKLFFIAGQLNDDEVRSKHTADEDKVWEIPDTCMISHFQHSASGNGMCFTEIFSFLHGGVTFDEEMKRFLSSPTTFNKVTYINNLTKQLHFSPTMTARYFSVL